VPAHTAGFRFRCGFRCPGFSSMCLVACTFLRFMVAHPPHRSQMCPLTAAVLLGHPTSPGGSVMGFGARPPGTRQATVIYVTVMGAMLGNVVFLDGGMHPLLQALCSALMLRPSPGWSFRHGGGSPEWGDAPHAVRHRVRTAWQRNHSGFPQHKKYHSWLVGTTFWTPFLHIC
jgi:hypothetical protein